MPGPMSHIPRANERSALQKLMGLRGLSRAGLYPAGKHSIAKMLAKGWIEQRAGISGTRYFITLDGEKALKAHIPEKGPSEKSTLRTSAEKPR